MKGKPSMKEISRFNRAGSHKMFDEALGAAVRTVSLESKQKVPFQSVSHPF